MKRVAAMIVAVAMATPLVTGCGATVITPSTSETTVKELGPARAQDDYYRFINEEYLKNTKIKYGEDISQLAFNDEPIQKQVEKVIDDCAAGSGYAKGSEEDIIKRAYESYQAYDFKNEPIPDDLQAAIKSAEGASSVDELLQIDAALVRDYGINGFFGLTVDVNPFKPTERIVEFRQITGVLNTTFENMRDDSNAATQIKKETEIILSTRGYDKETTEKHGKALAILALDLYGGTDLSIADELMPYKYMRVISADEAEKLMSNVDLKKYIKTFGINTSLVNEYLITDEGQVKALNKIFEEKNLDALKAWEIAKIYEKYMKYIAPHYIQLESYVKADYKSEHDQAIDEIKDNYSAETDPIYVERYYTAETDEALRSMCDDIKVGYKKLISGATWLSEGTRKELLNKLNNIVYITGSNSKRHDNVVYANISGKNYYELKLNYTRIKTNLSIDTFNKQEPVSREEIGMPMQTMNACYDPSGNTITITVAITNKPFFDAKADYYTNLGGLGSVIAHEMGHAFDSNCIVFNSKGEYNPSWIPDQDMNALIARNEKASKYFEDNFTVFGIYHVDGDKTLGENFADLGGVECITSLCKTKEDRIKLFENYATIWCMICTDEAIIYLIAFDEHSPNYIRVNAILSSVDAFYETYDVKEGDGMYIAPENRISRWY